MEAGGWTINTTQKYFANETYGSGGPSENLGFIGWDGHSTAGSIVATMAGNGFIELDLLETCGGNAWGSSCRSGECSLRVYKNSVDQQQDVACGTNKTVRIQYQDGDKINITEGFASIGLQAVRLDCEATTASNFVLVHTGAGGDGMRWSRGPGGPAGNNAPSGDSTYTSGNYEVLTSQSLSGCQAACRIRTWCQGIAFQSGSSQGSHPDFQSGACQLVSQLTAVSTSVRGVDSYRREACAHDYSEDGCRVKAQELGLQLGGGGFAFAGACRTTGCYAYDGGSYSGMAFYGYLASGGEVQSASQLTAVSGANKYRVQPCQATATSSTMRPQ